MDITILEAENGPEALRAIQNHHVDLVILDPMMPIIDGFTFLEQLKTNPKYAAIPVIVNCSLEHTRSMQKRLALGSHDYFCQALPYEKLQCILPLRVTNAIHTKGVLDDLCLKVGRLESEIQAAGKYQRFLLPKDFAAIGMQVETVFHPYLEVSGDFFDFVPLQDEKTPSLLPT
jgi:sigma-B regulation protein RsbU (phosphoserine phosphatase)